MQEYEWKVSDKDPEVPMGFPPDPIWTESNWELGLPSLQYFQVWYCSQMLVRKVSQAFPFLESMPKS